MKFRFFKFWGTIFDGVDLLHNRIESISDESSNQYRSPRNGLVIVRKSL